MKFYSTMSWKTHFKDNLKPIRRRKKFKTDVRSLKPIRKRRKKFMKLIVAKLEEATNRNFSEFAKSSRHKSVRASLVFDSILNNGGQC